MIRGLGGWSCASGGQQHNYSEALAADPSILILDEATAALDNESEKIIQKSRQGDGGRTTLAITIDYQQYKIQT